MVPTQDLCYPKNSFTEIKNHSRWGQWDKKFHYVKNCYNLTLRLFYLTAKSQLYPKLPTRSLHSLFTNSLVVLTSISLLALQWVFNLQMLELSYCQGKWSKIWMNKSNSHQINLISWAKLADILPYLWCSIHCASMGVFACISTHPFIQMQEKSKRSCQQFMLKWN